MSRARALVAGMMLGLSACDADRAPPGPPPGATKGAPSKAALLLKGGSGYEVAEVPNPGAVAATARFAGDAIPSPGEVPISTDTGACGVTAPTEDVLVDKETRGLKNVIVRLEGIARGKAPPELVKVTSRRCRFEPHAAVAVRGTKIALENADPVRHVAQLQLAGESFVDVPLAAGEPPPPARPIPRQGMMEITCALHSWSHAYVYVHGNPYIAVTDAAGKLLIDGIPPGKYQYVAWHEGLGEKRGEVEVLARGTADLMLEFAPPD